jgi:ParB-like chromosome segregation protein Spo0J
MEITKRRLADIVPYAGNAKKHDKRQINNVAESIKQYGFVQPIVIDRDGVIVIGHCRALAAKKLGMEEVPCVCVDDLTPEQVNALRLVDNKSNESDWDFDLLADELPGLDLFAGSGTTIMAAEQNGRHAFCMEYDPKYADVIIDRWEKFTGEKAVLLNDD